MDLDYILDKNKPNVSYISKPVSEFDDSLNSLRKNPKELLVIILRGKRMKTSESLFNEFAAAFQFPNYFGENWNALDECISDLSWLPFKGYIMAITEPEEVLSNEPNEEIITFVEVLKRAIISWSKPYEEDKEWGRPAKTFRIIFQCEKEKLDKQFSEL